MEITNSRLASIILIPISLSAIIISGTLHIEKHENNTNYFIEKNDINKDKREDYIFSSENRRYTFLSNSDGSYNMLNKDIR